jgi:rhodanese-related sulfurtransferase
MMILAMLTSQLAVGEEGVNAVEAAASRDKGRSRTQTIAHTTDPLDSVLRRVHGKEAFLIDVREQREWNAGHLRHAVLLPLSQLKQSPDHPELQEKLRKLSKEKPVYCHCKSGGRVLAAAPILRSLGFDVRPLKSGYDDLLDAGFVQATDSGDDSGDKE